MNSAAPPEESKMGEERTIAVLTLLVSALAVLSPDTPVYARVLLWAIVIYAVFLLLPQRGISEGETERPVKWKALNALFTILLVLSLSIIFLNYYNRPVLVYEKTLVQSVAGNGVPGISDGGTGKNLVTKPSSLVFRDEKLYFVDDGSVRVLFGTDVVTLYDSSDTRLSERLHGRVWKLRAWKNDLFVLSEPWLDVEGDTYYVSLFRLRNGSLDDVESVFETSAVDVNPNDKEDGWVSDFTVQDDGVYYIRVPGRGVARPKLQVIPYDKGTDGYHESKTRTVAEFPYSAKDMIDAQMVFSDTEGLFVSVPGQGVILRISREDLPGIWESKLAEVEAFVGKPGSLTQNDHFIPWIGSPTFKLPGALAFQGDSLYVMDFGVVRKIVIKSGEIQKIRSLSGSPPKSDETDEKPKGDVLPGNKFWFLDPNLPNDVALSLGLAVDADGRIFFSGPDFYLYRILENS